MVVVAKAPAPELGAPTGAPHNAPGNAHSGASIDTIA
jgi:hypothetical protein